MSNIRVRFVPSPTGYLHTGGVRQGRVSAPSGDVLELLKKGSAA